MSALPKILPDVDVPPDTDPLILAKDLAAAGLPRAVNKLLLRIEDERITTPNLNSCVDQLAKIAGAFIKQEAKPAGPGFSIQIVLGDGTPQGKTITIGGDTFGPTPDFVLASPPGNLSEV